MSKKPPLPEEAIAPYPIEEPPHEEVHENETVKAARAAAEAKKTWQPSVKQIGIGAAVGIGSAAIVAGLLFWKGNRK